VVLGTVLIATAGMQTAHADRVTSGVRVLTLDLGGRSRDEARALLQAEGASLSRQPVVLRAGDHELRSTVRDLGASLDVDAMLDSAYAVGRSGNPLERAAAQWTALVFGQRIAWPDLEFDAAQQEAELSRFAAEVYRAPADASAQIARLGGGFSVNVTPEQPGLRLLLAESGERVREALSHGDLGPIDLATEVEAPALTTADFREPKAQVERALAGPLYLTLDNRRWALAPDEIARVLRIERTPDATVQVAISPEVSTPTLDKIAREVQQPGENARFELAGSALRVLREGKEGRGLDREALSSQMLAGLLGDERTVALRLTVQPPAVTAADGAKLHIKELIGEGRTSFAGSTSEKAHNIRLAASRLHGTVVPPGGMFSFNREVGPTTLASGFRTGWGITLSSTGAQTIPSVAGGICQVATTLFHPVFHSGYSIEERNSHLYWIPSYGQPPLGMKGLDATVDEDYGLDFRFINTTSDYLLIQARASGGTLIFSLHGTKPAWQVKVEGPTIINVVSADREIVRRPEPSMPVGRTLQVEGAQDGFDVTIVRTVTLGDDVRTLRLRSHYIPSKNVILHGTGA
jgi:vancomycin resistance protein YoaR